MSEASQELRLTGNGPVVVTAYFYPLEGKADVVRVALDEAIPVVHGEPGCLLYAINEAPDGTIVMIEKWESAESLAVHAKAPAGVVMRAALDGALASPIDVTVLTPLPVGDPIKGAL